jgi:hypothetical protein
MVLLCACSRTGGASDANLAAASGGKPVEQVARPVEQVAKPVEQVAKPVEQVAKPVEQASSVPPKPVSAKKKLSAPAEARLSTSGATGEVQVILTVRATADIPRAVARFVVPEGVLITGGEREKDLGPLAKGDERQLRLTLSVPSAGSFVIAGGIDLHLSSGVRLHVGDAVRLGGGS